jgi:hypothetical protein
MQLQQEHLICGKAAQEAKTLRTLTVAKLLTKLGDIFCGLRTLTVYTVLAMSNNYEYIFKYIIIGDMGVGKSWYVTNVVVLSRSLLHQFTENRCMS